MAIQTLVERGAAALNALSFVALKLPAAVTDQIALTLETDTRAVTVRLTAIVRGSMEHVEELTESIRCAAELRGYKLYGGAGFDISRAALTRDQHRLQFICPMRVD